MTLESHSHPERDERLSSWKEIAAYLKRGVSTVQRWERQEGLPVHRLPHGKLGSIYGYKGELDAWWKDRGSLLDASESGPPEPEGGPEPESGISGTPGTSRGRVAVTATFAALALLAVVWVTAHRSGIQSKLMAGAPRVVPLTSSPGLEYDPALSPDGRQLAFVWDGDVPHDFHIYVKAVGSPSALRLTRGHSSDCCPAWSPDLQSLAFLRRVGREGALMTVPALGGIERRLGAVTPWFGSSLSFSPDGKLLAYSDRSAPEEPYSVFLLSLESLATRRLTTPSSAYAGDAFPKFSPDGRLLAFARLSASGDVESSDFYVVPAEGGEPRPLTSGGQFIGDLDWDSGSGKLLFFSNRSGRMKLWQIGVSGGPPLAIWPHEDALPDDHAAETLAEVSHAFKFSITRGGKRLAYTKRSYDTNIWRIPAKGPAGATVSELSLAPLIASTHPDESPQYSPNGQRIAFASLRSGRPKIWVCDEDGKNCGQLTASGEIEGTPRWSPDGASIAFDAHGPGQAHIDLIDVETRLTRHLMQSGGEDVVPSWSRDGRFVYYASNRTGSWEVWKTPARGGEASRVTKAGGFDAFESFDGRSVLFTKFEQAGLWSVPASGGPETRVLDRPQCWGQWALARDGVYFVDQAAESAPTIGFLDLASGQTSTVVSLKKDLPCAESALAISPDGLWLLYVGIEQSSDIMMLDGLRQ